MWRDEGTWIALGVSALFLVAAGIPVNETVPLIVGLAAENTGYLQVKRERMGHQFPASL